MRVTTKNGHSTFTYKKEISVELANLEKEERRILKDLPNFKWAHEKAKREYEAKTKRLDQIATFRELVKEKQDKGEDC